MLMYTLVQILHKFAVHVAGQKFLVTRQRTESRQGKNTTIWWFRWRLKKCCSPGTAQKYNTKIVINDKRLVLSRSDHPNCHGLVFRPL